MKNAKFLLVILILATVIVAYTVFLNPSSSFAQQSSSSTTNRTFYLFNSHVPNANETKLGIPTDLFTPSSISVNKGDIVTIHFYNVENEPHTFTIGMPYNIDKNVLPGQNTTIIFKADHDGIYQYYCKYHLPTMAGQLIIK
ncbi:MAG: cupredoxin domain-containing protein [Candidatus Nitrosocosmicus sp.]